MSITVLRICGLGLSLLTLGLALGSCGKVAEGDTALLDSNTNWLMRCSDDLQCDGSLRCYCGICTKPCGQSSECGLLSGAECAESGQSLCGQDASAGGLCVLTCQQSSDCGAGFNCTTGQCVPKPCVTLRARDWDEVFGLLRANLTEADPEDAPYLRYFAIGNSSGDTDSAGGCGVEPEVKHQALSKLLNSLSLNPVLTAPTWVEDGRLFRIDLRDYDWDRPVQVNGGHSDVWEALVANDPYAVSFVGEDADEVVATTATLAPILLVDSFIATATEPEVYYGLLDVPELPVPFLAASAGAYVLGPGTVEAGFVDQTEILARYWPMATRAGYVWSIADVGREPGALFATPLEDPLGERELVYTLPNRLHAFAFMSPSQQRLDSWRVTPDNAERDGLARVPRSNWRRHPGGQVSVRDEVHDYVAASFDQYTQAALTLLRQRFPGPEELSLLLQSNYERFMLPSLITIQIDDTAPDPILAAFAEFDRDVTLEVAAAELMVTPQSLRRNLALLDPALAALSGGSVARPVFTGLYRQTLCALSLGLENQPAPGWCP
jgi:hypothetical protein